MINNFEKVLAQDLSRYQQQLRETRSERQASKVRLLVAATEQRLRWKHAR